MFQHPDVFRTTASQETVAFYNTTLDGRDDKDSALDGITIAGERLRRGMTDSSKPGPKPTVTDEEILALFRETDDPVLSTAEVTEGVSLKRRSVYDRLTKLAEQEKLNQKEIGGRNTVWWLVKD